MPFRFSLDSVLHLYRSLEHQQELRLRAANQQVTRVRHLIQQVDARTSQSRERQSRDLEAGTTAAELRFELSCELSQRLRRRELEEELANALTLRERQQTAFQEARRRRETLEDVRNTKFQRYQIEASRRAQRQVDDLFLLRRKPSNRG